MAKRKYVWRNSCCFCNGICVGHLHYTNTYENKTYYQGRITIDYGKTKYSKALSKENAKKWLEREADKFISKLTK